MFLTHHVMVHILFRKSSRGEVLHFISRSNNLNFVEKGFSLPAHSYPFSLICDLSKITSHMEKIIGIWDSLYNNYWIFSSHVSLINYIDQISTLSAHLWYCWRYGWLQFCLANFVAFCTWCVDMTIHHK